MIIEIMLIILAMISVVVNTIVSVIIIKDTLNNRKLQDRIDKQVQSKDYYQYAKQELEKDIQKPLAVQIQPRGAGRMEYQANQEQRENNQNDTTRI